MKKNILIISNPFDSSTNDVIDWIDFFGHIAHRLNPKGLFNNKNVIELNINGELTNFDFCSTSQYIELKNIYSIWYRKNAQVDIEDFLLEVSDEEFYKDIKKHLIKESLKAKNGLFSIGLKKRTLGDKIIAPPSKIEMLLCARDNKIDIPDTLVTNNKQVLKGFITKHNKIITKPLSEITGFEKKGMMAALYTELVDVEYLNNIPPKFFISLFQEAIEKEFEVRTFYIDGKCFSAAIFSQLDTQTNIDFRMYNLEKSNRYVPYKLEKSIEMKICKLMQDLKLKTGSLDFIKTPDDRMVFLEINPWGQYGYASRKCNYQLDKLIAEYLIN